MQRSTSMPAQPAEQTIRRRSSVASIPEAQVKTLFQHRSVRIVSFMTTTVSMNRHNSKHAPGPEDEVGTLSWTSPLERLLAVGPLTIYKAPGSVAFLSCVNVMHPILPKSQCWCVDDSSSNFVLQIRRPQYWRIEVPIASLEDRQAIKGLRDVLSQVLLFEKTPCPFKRSFVVELPEVPATPVKKRPWKPVLAPKNEAEKRDMVHIPPEIESGEECCSVISDDSRDIQIINSDSDATDDTNVTPRNPFRQSVLPSLYNRNTISTPAAPAAPGAGRSTATPPQLKVITSSPSKDENNISALGTNRIIESASSDYSSSVESFHTVQSWHSPITPLPPSPPESHPPSPMTYPYPHDNICLPKRPTHAREISEITITPESPRVWDVFRSSSTESVNHIRERFSTPPPTTPENYDEMEEILDGEHFKVAPPPSQQHLRHRSTTRNNSRRRALSPLPPAANIFSPSRRRSPRLQTARHLPTAIIQKTYEILLSPPSHLIHLMLNIAAKIAAGEWRGTVFGFAEGDEKMVSQWDHEDGEMSADSWEVDDYGISLAGKQSSRSSSNQKRVGRSWEVD